MGYNRVRRCMHCQGRSSILQSL
ncbi:hypothetical protein ACHAXN_004021 [Cyclotella atomus]